MRERRTRIWAGLAGLILGVPGAAGAAGFAVVGSVAGGPLIGAVSGHVLYGVVPYGGGSGAGELFSITLAGHVARLHDFAAGTDGSGLTVRLVRQSSGDLVGIASSGGQYGGGTLWRYAANKTFGVLHAFGASGDGSLPLQGPVGDQAGDLFGTTAGGAVATNGNAFKLSASGTYASLHDFLSGTDGHCPFSGAARGPGAELYGTTVGNGFGGNPNGSVWKISAQGTLSTLYAFTDGADGEWPHQAPVVDAQGNVFGTTSVQQGNSFDGALWTIGAKGGFKVLHGFTAATDGSQPNSILVSDGHGTLFGTTATGGPGGYGTVFSITEGGTFTVLHAFANGADGGGPTGSLVRNAGGVIFGGTQSGQVFRITP